MKKFFSLLAVLALVGMVSSAVWAADLDSKSAKATFEGGSIAFSADLYQWESTYAVHASTGLITWTTGDVTLGSSEKQWVVADAYCLIKSTITSLSGEVYMYTDVKNNTANYKVAADAPGNWGYYAGLIKSKETGGNQGYSTDDYAMLNFMCVRVSSAIAHCQTRPNFKSNPYGAKGMIDVSDTGTAFNPANAKIANVNGNWLGNTDFDSEDVVMFFGAEFVNVKGGNEFGTNTIKFVSNAE